MEVPAWTDAGRSLEHLQVKVKRAQSLSAQWSETLANSLSTVDSLRKRLEQELAGKACAGQNGSDEQTSAPRNLWLAEISENLDTVCENLEACFDQAGTLQNTLDDAADISDAMDAQVTTMQNQLDISRGQVAQLRRSFESNHFKEHVEPDEHNTSPSSTTSIEQLKNVVEVLQAQLHTAQELLADRQREVQLLERRISSQSEHFIIGVGTGGQQKGELGRTADPDEEGSEPLPASAVVEVLQTQIKAAQEQLAEKDTEVRRLERRLSSIPSHRTSGWSSMGNFASFTGAEVASEDHPDTVSEGTEEELSPVSLLRASKEVLQSQFAACKECLAQRDAEIEALQADRERLQAQVAILQQRLSNVQVAMLQQQLDQVNTL